MSSRVSSENLEWAESLWCEKWTWHLSQRTDLLKCFTCRLVMSVEKAMATHSSTLAWKIPWTEEPGRLQSKGSRRFRHNWVTHFHFHFSLSCTGEGNGNPLQCSCPGTVKPGGLPSMGLHRVGHDWSNLAAAAVVSDFLRPHGLEVLCPWIFPSNNTVVGCHFLLQGIFPVQGSNPDLLHCRWILYHLSHQGSPAGITPHCNFPAP